MRRSNGLIPRLPDGFIPDVPLLNDGIPVPTRGNRSATTTQQIAEVIGQAAEEMAEARAKAFTAMTNGIDWSKWEGNINVVVPSATFEIGDVPYMNVPWLAEPVNNVVRSVSNADLGAVDLEVLEVYRRVAERGMAQAVAAEQEKSKPKKAAAFPTATRRQISLE